MGGTHQRARKVFLFVVVFFNGFSFSYLMCECFFLGGGNKNQWSQNSLGCFSMSLEAVWKMKRKDRGRECMRYG